MNFYKNINWDKVKLNIKATGETILWASFIVTGILGSLALRGNLPTDDGTRHTLGTILAGFILYFLVILAFSASKGGRKK